ncbi:hypothetical protein BDY19DRAFT_141726 [Irpex rosettiformis]|uniref:Uncharacterized protein n=1 Tax=Irpex rosettiformis TaxID=378272 RepID=A0ACB8TM08_9APHY|nr:hypothetical protein BDY19DRAFT_141726 [Irpex rosettiformis]
MSTQSSVNNTLNALAEVSLGFLNELETPVGNTHGLEAVIPPTVASSDSLVASDASILGKRVREGDNDDASDDVEQDQRRFSEETSSNGPSASVSAITSSDANQIALARRIGRDKGFNEANVRLMEDFARMNMNSRLVIIYAELIANGTHLRQLRTHQASWKPSESLEKNIKSAAPVILLSPQVSAYKGNKLAENLLEHLRVKCSEELSPNIMNNHAEYNELMVAIRDALTQCRSKIKKALRASIKPEASQDKWNIYDLADHILKGTNTKPNLKLCARLALMRMVYTSDSDKLDKFWETVDETLEGIRRQSNNVQATENRLLASILNKDRGTYGVRANYEIEQD